MELFKKFTNEKIILIQSKKNGGYGYGNNIGIRYSYETLKAKYIVIANPDVIFSEKTIVKLYKVLEISKKHAISAPVPLSQNKIPQETIASKIPNAKQEILESSVLYNRIFGIKRLYPNNYFTNKEYCYVDIVQGSLLMVRSDSMINYGMYDEDFFLYSEEQVLAQKLKLNGFKTILIPNESYVHNHSVSINKTYKSLISKKKLYLRSKLLYLKKYNKLSNFKIILAKLFFSLTIIETILISIIKRLNNLKLR
jgi:GT2 family glycosyltransferase